MPASTDRRDLVIVGGGIGGVISLKYAIDAGLDALVLEREDRVGGLWRDLPSWQDIQFRKEDWTLGDLPIAGEDQTSIRDNIQAWVERFDLAPRIRLGSPMTRAHREENEWRVATQDTVLRAPWLLIASGVHNRPRVPAVERGDTSIVERHSSALRDPELLRDKRVTVVGGGASGYDLLALCFTHSARSVAWVYRSARWMRPTRKKKYYGTDVRTLARYQMLGRSVDQVNRRINADLRRRYRKAGVEEIMPEHDFDIRRDQVIPGRRVMIDNFDRIQRFQGEVRAVHGDEVHVDGGERIGTDLLLWATGYDMDLRYLDVDGLADATRPREVVRRCWSGFLSTDADNLFLLAPAILESTTSAPWAYAHVAKSMMAHIGGRPIFVDPPTEAFTNHLDLVRMLAPRDRDNYWPLLWRLRYLYLAFLHPKSDPMPIP